LSALRFFASSAQLDESFSDLTAFLSPGLATVVAAVVPGAPTFLWIVPLISAATGFGGSSGFLATSTFFGAFIIARIACASSSAALRRLARSAARTFSSSTTSAALITRNAGLTTSAQPRRRAPRPASPPQQRQAWRQRLAWSWSHSGGCSGSRGFGGRSSGGLLLGGHARSLGRVARFLLFAQAALLGERGFLFAQLQRLGLGFFFAAREVGVADDRLGRLVGTGCGLIALDEGALLAHFHLDRAGLAARIGLLDLAGRLACQRDLLAFGAGDRAVRRAQVVEQALLVGLGQRIVRRRLADAGRLQLLEQCRGGAIELGGRVGRRWSLPWVESLRSASYLLFAIRCRCDQVVNQCSRAFMMTALACVSSPPMISISSSTARFGQVVAGVDATVRERRDQLGRQAVEVAQVLRDIAHAFFLGELHRQQRVLGAGAQLVHGCLRRSSRSRAFPASAHRPLLRGWRSPR